MSNWKSQKPANGKEDNVIPVDIASRDRLTKGSAPAEAQADPKTNTLPQNPKSGVVAMTADKPNASEKPPLATQAQQSSSKEGTGAAVKNAETSGEKPKDAKSTGTGGTEPAAVKPSTTDSAAKPSPITPGAEKAGVPDEQGNQTKATGSPGTPEGGIKDVAKDEAKPATAQSKRNAPAGSSPLTPTAAETEVPSAPQLRDGEKPQAKAHSLEKEKTLPSAAKEHVPGDGRGEARPEAKDKGSSESLAGRVDLAAGSKEGEKLARGTAGEPTQEMASGKRPQSGDAAFARFGPEAEIPEPLDFHELFPVSAGPANADAAAQAGLERAKTPQLASEGVPAKGPEARPQNSGAGYKAAVPPVKDLIPDLPWSDSGGSGSLEEKLKKAGTERADTEREAEGAAPARQPPGNAKPPQGEKEDMPDKGVRRATDPIAEAVQSALRNVYGDTGDEDIIGAAGIDWQEAERDAPTGGPGGRSKPAGVPSIDDETAEAVLSYLYEQMSDTDGAADTAAGRRGRGSVETDADEDAGTGTPEAERHRERAPRLSAERQLTAQEDSFTRQLDDALRHGLDDMRPETARQAKRAQRGAPASRPPVFEPADLIAEAPAEDIHGPLAQKTPDDSGRLLGAAGLGLIGGIALAGVLSVFIFNSFVSEPKPDAPPPAERDTAALEAETAPGIGAKEPDKLSDAVETTSAASEETTAQGAEAAPEMAARTERPDTEAHDAASRLARTEAEDIKISVADVTDASPQAGRVPLKLSVPKGIDDAVVRLSGLPQGMKLSAGIDTGDGSWLLSASRTEGLALTVPAGYRGKFDLTAQLLAADARTPLSEPVNFGVEIVEPAKPATSAVQGAALQPQEKEQPVAESRGASEIEALIEKGNALMRAGDAVAARQLFERAAGMGSGEAALALGKSYDPIHFDKTKFKTGKPDAARAFQWYQKAKVLGQESAHDKIVELKSWLLQ